MRESTPFPCRQIPTLRPSVIYSFAVSYSVSYSVIGHSEVRRRVDKYLEKAGLPHMKVHGFRHSCVSYLLSKGMSYGTVPRWVGDIFMNQVSKVAETLEPIGIIVYGPAADDIFVTPRFMGIPIYPFKSFMQKRNSSRKKKKEGGGSDEE